MATSPLNFQILPLLTPAEALVLLHGKMLNFKQLLKLTLMDLLLKKVLAIRTTPFIKSSNQPVVHMYLHRGAKYAEYRPLAHEAIYTKHFAREPNREISFINLIRLGRRYAISTTYLRQKIMKTPQLLTSFERGFWISLTDKVKYTAEGALKRTHVETELNELTNLLPQVYHSDRATVRRLLHMMNGNLFLSNAIDHNLLLLVDEELSRLFAREHAASADDDSAEEFLFIAEDWSFDDSFEDGFGSDSDGGGDSSDGGGDSGCGGGDSGCGGGDSGCGGGDSGCGGGCSS
ncbi:MAG: hypothetical protein RMJ87_11420 [Cytophagales bacterium]|nr:hypothetical protein [Bernardetiaceae bacterium]MDW8205629.1 hypothetical protein [Cytophagales bacterium]